ncbi:MAG: CAP domain-containing protein [Candidatus Caenarcaniphilales bacterium]|nr:CAP domain-containing protein [Candidatus Caenarcaniphilales bacterium]
MLQKIFKIALVKTNFSFAKQFLLIFLLSFSSSVISDSYFTGNTGYFDPKIEFTNFNEQYLEFLILDKVNQIRETYNAQSLKYDEKLKLAAYSQAKDMKRWNRVSHTQISLKKATLMKRMQYFHIPYKYVGENLADVYLDTRLNVNFSKETIWVSSYKEAADTLVLSWKYSPGHFENMIDPKFKYTGIKVTYNQNRKTIYAAQVFGG